MRIRAVACAITITAVGAAGVLAPAAQTSAPSAKKKTITCKMVLQTQSFPTATAPGEDYGTVDCGGRFGKGIQHDTFTLTPATATTGTAELRFKAYFDRGTVSGVWNANYEFTSETVGTFVQTVKWTKGTGAFKGIKGTGTGTGTQNGNVGTVTQRIKVNGAGAPAASGN